MVVLVLLLLLLLVLSVALLLLVAVVLVVLVLVVLLLKFRHLSGLFNSSNDANSSKVAAYRWARARWLSKDAKTPANPAKLGYYADYWAAQQGDRLHAAPGLTEVGNHDYFIAHRAFFFDLSVWADEAPVDDKHQALGADKAELVAIFQAAYDRTHDAGYSGPQMLHIGGFTPWWFKYTQDGPGGAAVSKHKGVETEWETMSIVGAYNAFDDGDACCVGAMANSAFYQVMMMLVLLLVLLLVLTLCPVLPALLAG